MWTDLRALAIGLLLLLSALAPAAGTVRLGEFNGHICDVAGVLSDDDISEINEWLQSAKRERKLTILVVTINSMSDYPQAPQNIEAFARWVGTNAGLGYGDTGAVLLVAVGDREARIELGAEFKNRYNAQAEEIMSETLVPAFRDGDYAGGIRDGSAEMVEQFANLRVHVPWTLLAMVGGVLLLVPVAYSLFRAGKRGWGWVVVGLILVLLYGIYRILRILLRERYRRRGVWSSVWGGGSSGGGFGGFGGGGGGFGGGGGASGSW